MELFCRSVHASGGKSCGYSQLYLDPIEEDLIGIKKRKERRIERSSILDTPPLLIGPVQDVIYDVQAWTYFAK